MDLSRIGLLIQLRYKLLWARARSRNGKIALFLAGYLLLTMVLALFSIGGIDVGMQAIRGGKGAMVAGIALGGIYLQALIASLALGFGMAAIFSEAELRRFPLKERERRCARHLIGIADPFWSLFLALDLGLALGLYLFGEGMFWFGFAATLMLFISNYLCARVLGTAVDRLMTMKGGGAALILVAVGCMSAPPILIRAPRNSPMLRLLTHAWHYSPPAGAAAAMARTGPAAFSGLAVLFGWLTGLTALLIVLERRPPRVRVARAVEIVWAGPIDRFGSLFGARHAVLVAQWLRFFSRNNRFRAVYPLALPIFAFLVYTAGRPETKQPFALTVAAFAILGGVTTGHFAVNQFGYLGGGFRRYLLLPGDPAAAFRAGAYLLVALGGALIPFGTAIWLWLSPVPFDAPSLVLLVGSSLTGLFVFHGVAVWTSLLYPRRSNYYETFGNDHSFAGNVTGMGGMLVMVLIPTLLARFRPGVVSPVIWWAAPPMAAAAVVFYFTSLRWAAAVFRRRRERLMALLEGRG